MSRWLEQRLRRLGQKTTELYDFAVYSLERLERGKTCCADIRTSNAKKKMIYYDHYFQTGYIG
jgi:hypothetical protein